MFDKFKKFIMGIGASKYDLEIEKLKLAAQTKAIEIEWDAKRKIERDTNEIKSNCLLQIAEASRVKNELYLQAQIGVLNHCKDMKLSVGDSCIASCLTALTLKDELDEEEKQQRRHIVYRIMERQNIKNSGIRSIEGYSDTSSQLAVWNPEKICISRNSEEMICDESEK